MANEVRPRPGGDGYEILVDGSVAGFTVTRDVDGRAVFTHTEIDPAFEGQGLGSQLARGALDAVGESGRRVVPLCEFIASYIERHPDVAHLVDDDLYERLRHSG